ncbi:MAG: N-acetyltransferase [Geminicoccaceae bacterium]|nr:MAG: N-acetyltransferase [Geminicoccaceae bacterium]
MSDAPTAHLVRGVHGIEAQAWDRLAPATNPFVRHGYLEALEASHSAVPETGWAPLPVVLGEVTAPAAIAPAYVKSHSAGEYVFDHGWAHAYERAGGRYYPKLQVAVPFTPVPGPRLLAADDTARTNLIKGLEAAAERLDVSSVHVTFCTAAEAALFAAAGWGIRHGVQYHWTDQGYGDFEGFLEALKSSKRKAMRKERRKVQASGIEVVVHRGAAITPADMEAFYPFYLATVEKRTWGQGYLKRSFFRLLAERLGDALVLVLAYQDGRCVAGAMHLVGGDTLYGRLWGALEDFKFLHFELCYYQAIDLALAWGLRRIEAGAQGEHKLQRGYAPARTYSAHLIRDPALRTPVEAFLARERAQIEAEWPLLESYLPYRTTAGDG